MTSSVSKSSIFIAFVCLLLFLLSSANGFRMLNESGCQYPSATFRGACFDDNRCNTQCTRQEGALRGFCPAFECWCEFSCFNLCVMDSGTWKGACVGHISVGRGKVLSQVVAVNPNVSAFISVASETPHYLLTWEP